jgi:hypothetical protein
MEKRVSVDRVKNEKVLQTVKEGTNIPRTIKRRKADLISHTSHRIRLLKHPTEGRKEVTGRLGKRRRELPDDLKEKRVYLKLKRGSTRSHSMDNTLCQKLWSTRKTRVRNIMFCICVK